MPLTYANLSPEAKRVTVLIRSVLVSRPVQPVKVTELLQDYKLVEGRRFDLRETGFNTIHDFLSASDEFNIRKHSGELYISAKPNESSSHISQMIAAQKKPRNRSSTRTNKNRLPFKSDQIWNKSSYTSQVYPRLNPPRTNHNNIPAKNQSDGNNNTYTPVRTQKENGQAGPSNFNHSNSYPTDKIENRPAVVPPTDLRQVLNSKAQSKSDTTISNEARLPFKSDQSWNKSSYTSQVYPRLNPPRTNHYNIPAKYQSDGNNNTYTPVRTQKENGLAGPSNFNRSNSYPNDKTENRPAVVPPTDLRKVLNSKSQSKSDTTISDDLRTKLDEKPKPKQGTVLSNSSNMFIRAPQNLQRTVEIRTNNRNTMNGGGKTTTVVSQSKNSMSQIGTGNTDNSFAQQNNGFHKFTRPSSIQNRLKIRHSNSFTDTIDVIEIQSSEEEEEPTETVIPPAVFEFNPNIDAVTSLAQYCIVRNLPEPDYKSVRVKSSGAYQCRVLINGEIYSTYPNEFSSVNDAKLTCAKLAVEQIKNKESRNRFPICLETDYEIALKIHEQLSRHSAGVFSKNVPLLFQEFYKQSLPDHWFSIIESTPKLFSVESTIENNYLIIYGNNQDSSSSPVYITSESDFIELDKIELKWDERYWDLYITNTISTTEVWAKLVGKDYSDKLDSLLTDIEVSMLTDQIRPNSIVCNQIYLVWTEECWHRVRVIEMDKLNNECQCFFIDLGNLERFPVKELFFCKSSFLQLAPQAILLSLYGLEDFSENPISKQYLQEMLCGKTLIGEIITKRDMYEEQVNSKTETEAKIQVALYDTSTEKDINLNPLLMNKICDGTPAPTLSTKTSNVNIAYIANNGDVYVQLRQHIFYVQRLINQLVESKFKEDEHKVTYDDLTLSGELFLIHDDEENRWARGSLANSNSVEIHSKIFEVFFVDYGCVKFIEMEKIFRLSSLSTALNKYPKQALKVRLYNLPNINADIIALMRGLLPLDSIAIVKLIVNGTVPMVDVYRRSDPNQYLFHVNDTVRIEYELQEEQQVALDKVSPLDLGIGIPSSGRNISTRSPVSVPASPQRSEFPQLVQFDATQTISKYFDIKVTMAANPGNFGVQPHAKAKELSELMKDLQIYYENNDEFIPVDMIVQGEAYAAMHKDGDYHRITVENILSPSSIHVRFCDFGGFDAISNEKLRILPPRFRNLPMLALKAKLFGIKPKDGDWNLGDCMRFRELTEGRNFVSVIKNISNDPILNSQVLELELIDTETSDDIDIQQILIDEGRATII